MEDPMALELHIISREEFMALRQALPAITSEHLFNLYGISENTWRRLREGRGVRRSTLDRIRARYARIHQN